MVVYYLEEGREIGEGVELEVFCFVLFFSALLAPVLVYKIPITRSPRPPVAVLGLGYLLQEAGSPGGRPEIIISQLLEAPGGCSPIFVYGCSISGFQTTLFDKAHQRRKSDPFVTQI